MVFLEEDVVTHPLRVNKADNLAAHWRTLYSEYPEPVQELRFDAKRRWRFDLAWPEQRLAVEVDGGVWSGGRHVSGRGFSADLEKMNAAVAAGWRVLRFTTTEVESDPVACMEKILAELRKG